MFLSIQCPVLFSIHTLNTLCSSVFSTLSCFIFILLTLYVPQYSVPCLVFYSYSWHFMFLSIQYPVLFSIHTLNTLCFSIQYPLVFYSYSWYFMFLSIQYPVLFSIHTLDTLCSSVFSTLSCFLFINTLCSSVFSTLSCFLFILWTLYVPQYSVPCLVFYSYSWYFMFLSIQYRVLFSIHTLDTLCSSVFSTLSCFLFILLILYVPPYSVPCVVFYSYSWHFMFLSIQYPVLFPIHILDTLCSSVFSTLSCFLFILLILYVPQYSVSCLVFYSYSWYFMFLSIQYPVLFSMQTLDTLCSSVFSILSCFLFILLTLYIPQYSVPCLVFYSYSQHFMFLSIQYPVLFSIHTLDLCQYSVPCLVFYSSS